MYDDFITYLRPAFSVPIFLRNLLVLSVTFLNDHYRAVVFEANLVSLQFLAAAYSLIEKLRSMALKFFVLLSKIIKLGKFRLKVAPFAVFFLY